MPESIATTSSESPCQNASTSPGRAFSFTLSATANRDAEEIVLEEAFLFAEELFEYLSVCSEGMEWLDEDDSLFALANLVAGSKGERAGRASELL